MNLTSIEEIKMAFERMELGTKSQREYFLTLNAWGGDANGIINYSEISAEEQCEKTIKERSIA